MRTFTFTFTFLSTTALAAATATATATATAALDAGRSANPRAAVVYGAMRYPDANTGLDRRQSPDGCHDNTVPCADFCITRDEQCCADGTSCLAGETCQRGADGTIGCCAAGTVCKGSVPTEDLGPAPTATSSPTANGANVRWNQGPVPTAAAAAVLAAAGWALL